MLHGILSVTTGLLLLGHGALGAFSSKPALTAHYASIGLQDMVVGGLTLTQVVGGAEMVLALAVLVAPIPSLLLGIGLWKMGTEALFMTAGALPFEWIERAGSYVAPFALAYLMVTHKRERKGSMRTLQWSSIRPVMMTLACLGALALPASGEVVSGGAQVGQWKTWVLTSGSAIPVPAPPAETSDQRKAELAELRQMQKERSPSANTAIQYYNAVPATQRWHDLAVRLARTEKQSANRQARLTTMLHTALHDAVIATWAAKYQFDRKPPSQTAPDVTPVVLITGAGTAPEPSYPSEHAALAGTAVGILAAFFPKEEAALQAMAAEVGQTRLLMGANYRSDIDAGFALGQAVAQKALARAATDGADAKWTGTVPTGPGMWVGTDPLEPLMGTWKPWLLTRGDQFRPEPPPAFDSAVFQEELALLKRINRSPTPSQRAIATNFAAKGLEFVWEPGYALVRRERLSVPREVRLLASFGVLQWDAYIAAHDAKYTYWRLRPNMADPTIVPLIPVPHHPAYVSNAAIIASAITALVGALFPQEAAHWQYLGEEAGLSRIYAGIHYPSDERAGNQMGKSLAALAVQRDQGNGP
jgi:membrane-associated phospholipid phosphatase